MRNHLPTQRRVLRARSFASITSIERFEDRCLLAAHVAGSSTSYATIQAAVNAAGAGGTITVDAGVYAEQVTVSKSLTIRGAQAGVDGASRAGASGASESVVSGNVASGIHSCGFYITANDVVIDGFTIQGQTSGSDTMGAGIVIAPNRAGTHIVNNVIQKNVSGLFLANNSGTDPAVIQHNYFANNNNDGGNSGRGIYTDGAISGGNLTNVLIDANTFVNNHGSNGFEAACDFHAGSSSKQTNIQITHNIMSGNGKAALFFNTTGAVISDNTITGSIDSGSGALRFEGNVHNITIERNTAHDNTAPAVAIDSKGTSGDSSGFIINNNNFFNNNTSTDVPLSVVFSKGVYSGTLDVRNNYWGSASGPSIDGPGTGDGVSAATLKPEPEEGWNIVSGGGELFSPWLASPFNSAPTLPTAPNNLSATLAGPGQVNLTWTDTAPGNETGFLIERGTDGKTFSPLGTTGAGVTRYSDTNSLAVGVTYYYRVAAVNDLGSSGYSNISNVTISSTTTTYLTDLAWASATIGWGSIGMDESVLGNTLSLRGTTYSKGIGTHAVSQIVYNLNGQYASFLSDVGVDDEENGKGIGSVRFQVLGDGKILYDSGVLTNDSAVRHVNVSVAGVKQLTLLATNGVADSIDYDHADWAGARLVAGAEDPPVVSSASAFALTALPSSTTAGAAKAFTLSALDADGNIVTGYTGTVHFTSTDIAAGLPANYTFTAADAGKHAFSVTFKTAGKRTITATDVAQSSLAATSSSVTVKPAAAARAAIRAPASVTAKKAFNFTVTLYDAFGNVATGYLGTLLFSSGDKSATLPASYTFKASNAGTRTFSATLRTRGNQTLVVTDKNNSALRASVTVSVR